jgi:hypothetical protein
MSVYKRRIALAGVAVLAGLCAALLWFPLPDPRVQLVCLQATNAPTLGVSVGVFQLENRSKETVYTANGTVDKLAVRGWSVAGAGITRGLSNVPPGGTNTFSVVLPNQQPGPWRLSLAYETSTQPYLNPYLNPNPYSRAGIYRRVADTPIYAYLPEWLMLRFQVLCGSPLPVLRSHAFQVMFPTNSSPEPAPPSNSTNHNN